MIIYAAVRFYCMRDPIIFCMYPSLISKHAYKNGLFEWMSEDKLKRISLNKYFKRIYDVIDSRGIIAL